MKTCVVCNETKELKFFYFRKENNNYRKECRSCHVKYRLEQNDKQVNAGKCKRCQNDRLKASSLCINHYVNHFLRSVKVKGTVDNINALIDKLYQQKFECWYTGVLLIPGVNASVDHTIPKAKNGSNHISNLVWVDRSINLMKNATDSNEFLTRFEDRLTEFNLLHSIDGFKNNRQKLSYVLGNNFALNQVIA